MTTQRGDRLVVEGQTLSVFPFPLGTAGSPMEKVRAQLGGWSTGVWRRYIATWSIDEGRLVLIDIEARTPDLRQRWTMEELFGAKRLSAGWYSGELASPEGEPVSHGFDPVYERDRVWTFERGELTGTLVRKNRPGRDLRSFLE